MNLQKQKEEEQLRAQWKERDRQLWSRIDAVIKVEEERLRAKQEAERRKREVEERIRCEAEEKKRQEEEKKQKEEEERRKQKEKEEEEKRKQVEAERARAEHERAEEQERKALGVTTALEDWKRARETLKVCPASFAIDVRMHTAFYTGSQVGTHENRQGGQSLESHLERRATGHYPQSRTTHQ